MNKKWEIVFDYLMHLIRENKVKAGEILPSQNMLKTKFKYSEQPIRIAFNKLIELQLVKPINGKGFVVQNKLQNNLLFSFRELFPNSKNYYFEFEQAVIDKHLAKISKIYEGTKVYKFKCLRSPNNNSAPIVYQESYIPQIIFKNISLNYLNANGLMKFIEEETNMIISHSSKNIYFENSTLKNVASRAFNEEGNNGYIVDVGNVYSIFGEVLEYRISYYKPEYFNWEFIEWRH